MSVYTFNDVMLYFFPTTVILINGQFNNRWYLRCKKMSYIHFLLILHNISVEFLKIMAKSNSVVSCL